MLRLFAVAIVLSCTTLFASAQTQPPPRTTPQTRAPTAKPAATPPTPNSSFAAPSTESGRCQIGVIPIAGNLFMVENFGPFAFTDKYARMSVDGWALDELVVSRVRAAAPGMSVRRLPFTKEELAQHRRPVSLFERDDNIREFAQYVARGTNCERYVLIHRHGGTQREFGIGISKYYHSNKVFLFAMMYVRVYDGRSFELIKKAPALTTEDTFVNRLTHDHLGGPTRELDPAMFPDKPTDAAANPVLRDGVRALLTAGLDKMLPPMLRQ